MPTCPKFPEGDDLLSLHSGDRVTFRTDTHPAAWLTSDCWIRDVADYR